MNNDCSSWELLAMYLNGDLPEDKLPELQKFFEENPDIGENADEIKSVVGLLPKNRRSTVEELRANYSALSESIRLTGRRQRRRKIYAYCSGAAAAVVIGLFSYVMLNNSRDESLLSIDALVPSEKKLIELVTETGDTVRFSPTDMINLRTAELDGEGLRYNAEMQDAINNSVNTIRVPNGETLRVVLQDGTIVYLNSASQLKFPVSFSGDARNVELDGEAFFEVTADKEKPFIIKTRNQSVTVLGTSFNVSAYRGDGKESVVLVSGSVMMNTLHNTFLVIRQGEMATLTDGAESYQVCKVDGHDYTSWKDGVIIFNRISLGEIMTKLARWYDVKIEFADAEVSKLHLTGAIEKEWTLSHALEMISLTADIEFEKSGDAILLRKQ